MCDVFFCGHHTQIDRKTVRDKDTTHSEYRGLIYYFAHVTSASLMKNMFWTSYHEWAWLSLPLKVSRACIPTALEDLTKRGKCILPV